MEWQNTKSNGTPTHVESHNTRKSTQVPWAIARGCATVNNGTPTHVEWNNTKNHTKKREANPRRNPIYTNSRSPATAAAMSVMMLLRKVNIFERRDTQRGHERPEPKKSRFYKDFIKKSNDFERRDERRTAAGIGPNQKSIDFIMILLRKVTILSAGASKGRRPGAARAKKVSIL